MPFVKTQPMGNAVAGEEGEKKPRKKAPTVAERFDAFKADFESILANYLESIEDANDMTADDIITNVWNTAIVNHVKKAASARGAFYTLFNRIRSDKDPDVFIVTATPTVGLMLSPSEVLDLTDGKTAITEIMLKKWADPEKGVPYGKGATADVRFYRRRKDKEGVVHEAYYKLEAYLPPDAESMTSEEGEE